MKNMRGKTTPDQVLQGQLDAIARAEGAGDERVSSSERRTSLSPDDVDPPLRPVGVQLTSRGNVARSGPFLG